MYSLRVFRSVAVTITTCLALACADSSVPTDPLLSGATDTGSDASTGTGGTASTPTACPESWTKPTFSLSGKKVKGARWVSTRVPVELTVSGVIGKEGGSLAIPGSQFVIYFPQDALPNSTTITITSKEADWVTYDMTPHGTVFRKPVIVLQGLENTDLFGTVAACSAYGAYLPPGNEVIGADDTASATETTMSYTVSGFIPWTQFSSPQTSVWIINHFSRYMLASG